MDGNPDDASGWKNKLKQAVAVNKQLVPLKLTMLLYYGGNQFPTQFISIFNISLYKIRLLNSSRVAVFAVHDPSNDPGGSQH
jgi:hypothetical protein